MIRLPKDMQERSKNESLDKSKHFEDLNQKYGNSLWIARVARKEVEKETRDLTTRVQYLKMMDKLTSKKIIQTEKLAQELQDNIIRNHEQRIKKTGLMEEREKQLKELQELTRIRRQREKEKKKVISDHLLKLKKTDAVKIKETRKENEDSVKEEANEVLELKRKKFNNVKSQENISQEKVNNYWINRQKLFADHLVEKIDVNDSYIQINQKVLARLEKEEANYLEKLQRSLRTHNNISQKLSNILLNQSFEPSNEKEGMLTETPRIMPGKIRLGSVDEF